MILFRALLFTLLALGIGHTAVAGESFDSEEVEGQAKACGERWPQGVGQQTRHDK